MKTILFLKQGDLITQLLAVFIPFVISIYFRDFSYMMGAYLSLGAVQVLSCLCNFVLPKRLRNSSRRNYQIALGLVALLALITLAFNDIIFIVGLALLVFSPFMAAVYYNITYQELQVVKRYTERNKYIMTN